MNHLKQLGAGAVVLALAAGVILTGVGLVLAAPWVFLFLVVLLIAYFIGGMVRGQH